MSDFQDLHRKLQLKSGSRLWLWPGTDAVPEQLAAGKDFAHAALADADVAVLFTGERSDVDAVMRQHREALASKRAVWVIYAKGNRTDMNRDTLWIQLGEYGWKAVSQVAFDDTRSALRVRPLKAGEAVPGS